MNAATAPDFLRRAALQPDVALALPRACTLAPLGKLPEGLDAWSDGMHGRLLRWRTSSKPLAVQAREVQAACQALDTATDAELQQQLILVRGWLRLDPLQAKGHLSQALATIGQVAARALGLKPYSVQYMGALAIQRGMLAEMATGEGKTLTVALAGVLAGFSGRPCHVITANDYLAERDAQEMTALYRACGLSVASVVASLAPEERPGRYGADVAYLTAKELLADYLKDTLTQGPPEQRARDAFRQWLDAADERAALSQERLLLVRGLHTAIVDEADSILIDEAVTPLILSAPRKSRGLSQAVVMVSDLAQTLQADTDFVAHAQSKRIVLAESAIAQLDAVAANIAPLWRPKPRREELLRQALMVRFFFRPGHQYLVQAGEVVLLDEFTGRMTPGRTLTAGLHQAIEAKEALEISDPNESLTQMSFQAFFRRFRRLAGSTGTAWEAAQEMWSVYRLNVVRIPTHRPRITHYRAPLLVSDEAQKWQAITREVMQERARGRPVLVGVRSVQSSEQLAASLMAAGCPVRVLNALAHAEEAEIVANAGQAGVVTIATNMAGRGTDIRLGQGVAERGGLHVIVAESNESARIDRQLAGRCGRQGDPGSVTSCLCLSDDLARRLMPPAVSSMLQLIASAPQAAQAALVRSAAPAFRWAQVRAEREAFAQRWSVLRSDDWMDSALPFTGQGAQDPA
jgi:preprotein translocase subunit SecA